jgi:hypothetical protein
MVAFAVGIQALAVPVVILANAARRRELRAAGS